MDISVILTAHREGMIVGATVASALEAIAYAEESLQLNIELIAVLDRSDDLTRETIVSGFDSRCDLLLECDEGDPGQSRNRGVEASTAKYVSFLDGDDLWSFNWLAEAWRFSKQYPGAIAHSACNVVFGEQNGLWWHVDSEGPLFDARYLLWAHYWDAMSFVSREIMLVHPFQKNDIDRGFGHEDWHWSVATVKAGIPHKPVPNTVHFKRRRTGSQMSKVDGAGCVVLPDPVIRDW